MATINESKTLPGDILAKVEEDGIEFIRFWFTDINGQLKSFAVGKEEMEDAMEEGAVSRFSISRRRSRSSTSSCSGSGGCSPSRMPPRSEARPLGVAEDTEQVADAQRRLTALPGMGAWTAAEIAVVALGDADAVSVGDYHLPHLVSWALAGEPRGTDERMLELLEPYAGQRGRVIRLLMTGGRGAPRYGPRLSRQDIRGR